MLHIWTEIKSQKLTGAPNFPSPSLICILDGSCASSQLIYNFKMRNLFAFSRHGPTNDEGRHVYALCWILMTENERKFKFWCEEIGHLSSLSPSRTKNPGSCFCASFNNTRVFPFEADRCAAKSIYKFIFWGSISGIWCFIVAWMWDFYDVRRCKLKTPHLVS